MTSIFQNVLGLLLIYKYLTLFLVAFASSLGIPLPAGSSTVAGAAFASQGYLNIFVVIATGALGNILGDLSMYALAKRYGRRVVKWFHLGKLVKTEPIKEAEELENEYSALAIITSRFQDQATAIINVIAGFSHMKFKRFALYAIIGDILQILFYSSIGYFFAANWQQIYNTLGVFSWLIVLVAIIISIVVAKKVTKRIVK